MGGAWRGWRELGDDGGMPLMALVLAKTWDGRRGEAQAPGGRPISLPLPSGRGPSDPSPWPPGEPSHLLWAACPPVPVALCTRTLGACPLGISRPWLHLAPFRSPLQFVPIPRRRGAIMRQSGSFLRVSKKPHPCPLHRLFSRQMALCRGYCGAWVLLRRFRPQVEPPKERRPLSGQRRFSEIGEGLCGERMSAKWGGRGED